MVPIGIIKVNVERFVVEIKALIGLGLLGVHNPNVNLLPNARRTPKCRSPSPALQMGLKSLS
jgi:hypothetical protein